MKPYTVVRSIAGKDKGAWFAVVGEAENGLLLIADGKSRRLVCPKRKKAKHLQFCKTALSQEDLATDRTLRLALRAVTKEGIDLG